MVRRKSAGFTLIEVIMVMAIAGLILSMIFIALPQVQRTRRDTQRKADLGKLKTQVEFYGSNHSGLYPVGPLQTNVDFWNSGGSPTGSYVPASFNDPSTQANYFSITVGTAGYISYSVGVGTGCDGTTALTSPRQYALHMTLEAGTACLDNL
jgi:prepilin-type N-terminal cleavage/methylation domain-containing protein